MKIISHRGYWKSAAEKNSELAFDRSFALGFGTETDIRDYCQELVVSHDMAAGNEVRFSKLLQKAAHAQSVLDQPLTLALNIKADGLAASVAKQLNNFPQLDCFVFDMSVPDMRAYLTAGVPVFTRMSEVEQQPAWLDCSAGVWLDAFESEWYATSDILRLLALGKRVCIVSPELHQRPYKALWDQLALLSGQNDLMLCTDLPEEATIHFKPARSRK